MKEKGEVKSLSSGFFLIVTQGDWVPQKGVFFTGIFHPHSLRVKMRNTMPCQSTFGCHFIQLSSNSPNFWVILFHVVPLLFSLLKVNENPLCISLSRRSSTTFMQPTLINLTSHTQKEVIKGTRGLLRRRKDQNKC